mmetsp:Transcript_2250/g.3221  ORF Transcript_2250/g.3221 Transcript_2250/m.3221 type:complete len:91 (+) Transcript_2250:125-397(+)
MDVLELLSRITKGTLSFRQMAGSKTGYVDGRLTEARFNSPFGLALSPDGQSIFTADDKNHAIRKISLSSGYVSTVIGGIHAPPEEKKVSK